MIEPNFNTLLWIILISISIGAVAKIIAGCTKIEKEKNFGYGDAICGVIELGIVAYVLLG